MRMMIMMTVMVRMRMMIMMTVMVVTTIIPGKVSTFARRGGRRV